MRMQVTTFMKSKRRILLAAAAAVAVTLIGPISANAQQKPNIVIIWGDDIGQSNISAYSHG